VAVGWGSDGSLRAAATDLSLGVSGGGGQGGVGVAVWQGWRAFQSSFNRPNLRCGCAIKLLLGVWAKRLGGGVCVWGGGVMYCHAQLDEANLRCCCRSG
jgi:hypothetical protein